MEKAKKIKISIGLFYFMAVCLFLYFLFSKFSLEEITSYEFIKNNREYFFHLRQSNIFLLSIFFILFVIVWVLAGGFGTPLALFAGFIFGKWLALLVLTIGMSIGATGLYIFANYFLKDFIKEKFLNKFKNLELKFKKSEFFYLLIYRFVGGIPFVVSNVFPCIFNVKIYNFFWSTLIGIMPSMFVVISIGSGLEKIIEQNLEVPTFISLITAPDIYIPLLAFGGLILITFFLRKFFYRN
ncbi:MAG: DedA family protein [Pelagibacteraceae bacterium]|nr:MAG: DedA family protein [Pelagibacteraceae bacterium]